MLLQKARHAKRIYSTIMYSKTNCDGYKPEGITYPSGKMQEKLLSEFYQDIQLDPSSIAYLEAHSTGTIVGGMKLKFMLNLWKLNFSAQRIQTDC